MKLLKELHAFFQQEVEIDEKDWAHFTWPEGKDSIVLSVDAWDTLKISWKQDGNEIMFIQNVSISNVMIIDDKFETSLQFMLERQPSRMFKVQLKPSLRVSYEMYFEVCEDCDEE